MRFRQRYWKQTSIPWLKYCTTCLPRSGRKEIYHRSRKNVIFLSCQREEISDYAQIIEGSHYCSSQQRFLTDLFWSKWKAKLRDLQTGFRKDWSYTDQIATLRIIIEQPIEWNSPLYIKFVDYERAFDSLDRVMLWKLLTHFGVPHKFVKLIRNSCEWMSCREVHEEQLTESFRVNEGVSKDVCYHRFCFFLPSTGSWRSLPGKRETEYNGHYNGVSWVIWILRTPVTQSPTDAREVIRTA
jgi:hypothetical protein